MTSPRLSCCVYKGKKRDDNYLFVLVKDDFSLVPEPLMSMLGGVQFVMDLELWPERPMAQVSAAEVIRQLREQGFYLQIARDRTLLRM